MTNKEKFEKLREHFNNNKLTIYNESWRSGYFVFELGDDSVVHFKVKELRGWLFGLFFGSEEKKDELFAQPINNIDKFKPSRSTFVTEVDLSSEWLYQTAEVYAPLEYSYYLSWYRDNNFGSYPRSWFHAVYTYYKSMLQQIYNNFIGRWVNIRTGSGWLTSTDSKTYPFKCVVLKLKYGNKIVWNRWRRDHKAY